MESLRFRTGSHLAAFEDLMASQRRLTISKPGRDLGRFNCGN
jgi:hypothetical protein